MQYRHWLPLLTFCPANGLPDLVYVTIESGHSYNLYDVRAKVRAAFSGKKMYMEEICEQAGLLFPNTDAVEVRLAFNRHVVRMEFDNV